MDETPNVNNLNGVPNFGHGFPEPDAVDVTEETEEAPAETVAEETPEAEPEVEALPEVNE